MITQQQVFQWARDVYGDIALNPVERALRVIEEAVELGQSQGVKPEHIQKIVDRVYSRPAGDVRREIGDLALTLMSLAENLGYDVELEADWVQMECFSKPAEYYRAKHAAKVAAGTAGVGL